MTSPSEDRTSGTTPAAAPAGLRRRIVTASPPAPVPVRRATPQVAVADPVEDKSNLRGPSDPNGGTGGTASDGDVVRATGSMAVATLLSRITGFIRTVMITSTLGGAIASAFQTANQLPNLITEIVLGAVLTSLVVPVLVRAEKEDRDRGEAFIRRLFTLAITLLGSITVLAVVFAPFLTTMMLPESGQVNTTQAVSFAYLLLPQICFYGLFALFQAILNTKGVFAPGAWAPVVNNIISIGVMALYWLIPGALHPSAASPITDPHVLLLGLGTTLGVVVQCLILVPYLKRAGINLKPLWGLDDRLKQFGGMAVAIIAYVAISQFGYVITSRVAATADAVAPVVYQNAWLLLQVPYGVIGVTLLTAIMPRLSRNAADGDVDAVVRDLTLGTKLTFIALIPIVIFMTGFGIPIARGLFQYGLFGSEQAELLGLTLSFSAFTLIPYALVLLHLRVFYAREEAWTPTFIIGGITATKVVLTLLAPVVANSPERVVILLGTANGFGFISGAVIGAFLLRRKLGHLGGKAVASTTIWAVISSAVGLVVAYAVNWLASLILPEDLPSPVILIRLAVLGGIFLVTTGIVLSRSGLPEVLNLGRALQRIPGMSRIIKVSPDTQEEQSPEVAEIPLFNQESFMASPVPPPMSAGIVRGPSLVAGAPVSDGRFRLLRDYGSVTGARFWKAREQATGREVALTFVDTTGQAPMAAASPAQAARAAAEVSRTTRKLRDLALDTVAGNIEILSYRSGCLVVADWVGGSSLRSVASAEGLDPNAVARALAPLFADAATAHAADIPLGLDNRARVRINSEGVAMLAFPAVLGSSSVQEDSESLGVALRLLVDQTSPTPKTLRDIAADAEALGEEDSTPATTQAADVDTDSSTSHAAATGSADSKAGSAEEPDTDVTGLAGISARLLEFAPDEVEEEEALPTPSDVSEDTHEPEQVSQAGFGSRGYSTSAIAIIGLSATAFVVAMAFLTVWIVSLLGNENVNTPVDQESIQGSQTSAAMAPAVLLNLEHAYVLPGGEEAPNLIDGETDTTWGTSEPNRALMIELQKPTQIQHVLLNHVGSTGAAYRIYGTNADNVDVNNPDFGAMTQLATGTLTPGRNAIDTMESQTQYDTVVISWVSQPRSGTLTLRDVQIAGQP